MKNMPNWIKNLLFAFLGAIVLCIIIIVVTIIYFWTHINDNNFAPPNDYISSDLTGELVASGPSEGYYLFEFKTIYQSDILNEEDKRQLVNDGVKKTDKVSIGFFIKDNKDMIYIFDETRHDKGKDKYYYFLESNLPYSFKEILQDFEKLIGRELSSDELNNHNHIFIGFNYSAKESKYIPYYKYNYLVYIVNK